MSLIEISSLRKDFPVGKGVFTALSDVNLTIDKGEFIGLVGPSGSGKTTLLNIVGSLDTPTDGKCVILDKRVSELSSKQAADLRNKHVGFIFQTYNLLPVYTVYENVEFSLLLQKVSAKARKEAVLQALKWVGLEDKVNQKVTLLSGGECQRVAIARAMVKKPDIVIADEPTANLDKKNSFHVLETMKKLNKELGTTFIFATHDEKVMQYLDRIVRLEDGKVISDELTNNN